MGSRYTSHQLSNGLFVSGKPEQPKEKPPTMTSIAIPYTGGDIKKSGELGKMFVGTTTTHSGPVTPIPNGRMSSGHLSKHGEPLKKSSGPLSTGVTRQNSGTIRVLPTTGLITSGPLNSSGGLPRKGSGNLDSSGSVKIHLLNQAVTTLGQQEDDFSCLKSFPKHVLWMGVLIFVMGFLAGSFILGAIHNSILLAVVTVLFVVVASILIWNVCWERRGVVDFVDRYPEADLRSSKNGQYVKVTGVVTCGNVPLESSFHKVPRCVYTSTSLYEYRGWSSKPANSSHRQFTWGLRSSERHAVDFYISDFQSGLRALVKTGNSARVTPLVDDSVVVDFKQGSEQTSPDFVRWLSKRNISSDDRIMKLKEGYIKEGSTVSVLGVVQRDDNVLMIVPSSEPLVAGWQWRTCTFSTSLEGIVLRCEDSSNVDAIPV